MDILERIIENLTSDEVRRFKILSNRFKADEEKKLLILFDAIRAGDFKSTEPKVVTQFYGDTSPKSRNSYYRLRNKLLSNLEKSLLFYHFNYKNSIESYSNIQLSILLRERGLYREAYYNLRKAEKVAQAYDQFNVLEVIYDEMVKLAAKVEVDIEKVIERRKENLKKIEILRANSEILGMVTQQLSRRNYARSKKTHSVIEMLEQIKTRLEEHADIFHSMSGQIMIMKTVASILIQKSAYRELALYCQKTFEELDKAKGFNRENHPSRLMLRIWRVNSLQKLLDIPAAEKEVAALRKDLNLYQRQNFNEYAFHYYAAKVYNLKLSGRLTEAAKVLDEAFTHKEILQDDSLELFLLISRADQYFSQEAYDECLQIITSIKTHTAFQLLDRELKFYAHVFEVVTQYEAGHHLEVTKGSRSLRKKFKDLLKDEFYAKARKFLDLIHRLNEAALTGKRVFIKAAYKNFVKEFPRTEIGDNQIILYEVYLRSKLQDEGSYYELLCEAVESQR